MPFRSPRLCILAVTLATNSVLAAAQTAAPPSTQGKAPPTADSLAAITARGRLLWQYDFVAASASDSVMAHRPADGVIGGYVARQRGDRWDVMFGKPSASGDTFYVAYEVRQHDEDPLAFDVKVLAPARPDTGYPARAMRAITLASRDFGPQQRQFNPAVLERPDGSGFWVYLTPAQQRAGVFPLGGDVRYLISPDGKTIKAKRALHNSILETAPSAAALGDKMVYGTHTAVLDDIVEDTDVFYVLLREPHVPEFVITDAFVYNIATNGAIRVVGRRSDVLGGRKP